MAEFLKDAPMHSAGESAGVIRKVEEMLAGIDRGGAEAIRDYSQRLDDWSPTAFTVREEEIEAATARMPAELRRHIAFAQEQVRAFAEAQLETVHELTTEPMAGVILGHRNIPVGSVGAYVPGGRYPMLASAFMTILVPKVAGVDRVVACAPPQEGGGINPATLHAIATSGADEILCLGGVQALAAMTVGLEEIAPVDMIVGPGNAYVAEAKRQLFGRVGIDLIAGPTEVLVIADETASPRLVAADLLGQAEHGPTSPAILVTTSPHLGRAVLEQIEELLPKWPTAVAGDAWQRHGSVVLVVDRDEAADVADRYAPEHLEVHAIDADLDFYLARLRNYGSLFLGEETTVAYGDKAVGTNHVLPTLGSARYTGGLWVGKFLKTCTYQRLSPEGTRRVAPAVAAISEAEGFGGHALTAVMRLERLAADAE